MNERYQRAARHGALIALAAAGVDAAVFARALDALPPGLDRDEAIARRDQAIRNAHNLVSSDLRYLTYDLHEFYARAWPQQRHLAEPPADATPLRRAYFYACQAAEHADVGMPGLRQVRRITNPKATRRQTHVDSSFSDLDYEK